MFFGWGLGFKDHHCGLIRLINQKGSCLEIPLLPNRLSVGLKLEFVFGLILSEDHLEIRHEPKMIGLLVWWPWLVSLFCKFGKMVEMCHWHLKFCGHFLCAGGSAWRPLASGWWTNRDGFGQSGVSTIIILTKVKKIFFCSKSGSGFFRKSGVISWKYMGYVRILEVGLARSWEVLREKILRNYMCSWFVDDW